MAHDDAPQWPAIFYGTAWKQAATADLTEQAIAAGFRALDTANQPQHYQESGVGEGIAMAIAQGGVSREQLFVQTKFSPLHAQGDEVPYKRRAGVEPQVEESVTGSLAHLRTDYLDSLLLHAPRHPRHMGASDWQAWGALEAVYERGIARRIGVSNVGPGHLQDLIEQATVPPMAVQNRCFARTGWDRDVRILCRRHGIAYQGFSLLTANPFVLEHPEIRRMAQAREATPQQVVFGFAHQVGMIPLTGTTDPRHMAQDLEAARIALDDGEIDLIEHIAAS